MIKKIALFTALALGGTLAQGGIAPKAADLLEKAKTTLGGAALENIKTYRETTGLTYYAPNGNVGIEVNAVTTVDFAAERLRLEVSQGGQVMEIDQVTPTDAWAWTKQTGTIKLPNVQAKPLRESFYQSWYGLRFGAKNRDTASADGPQNFADQKGEAVTVTTKGTKATYLFDTTGGLIAEKSQVAQIGEVVTVYGAYRAVDGLQIPFEGTGYVGTQKFFAAKVSDAKINPALTEADFAQPK
jgi:hypothetical protein